MAADFTVIVNGYMPLKELVLTTLRQAILKGEIQPGERLMEMHLAAKMGVSRTPIREAIKQLSVEGLVIMIPRKGAIVAGISEKMLTDVLEVRMTLEKMAYEKALQTITQQKIAELTAIEREFEAAIAKDDITDIALADEKFHFAIYNAAGNDKLKEILSGLRENMYRYRLEHVKMKEARGKLIQEHKAIIHALKEGLSEDGLSTLEHHIESQKDLILTKIKEDLRQNQPKQSATAKP